jgi:hypothetical protein
MGTGGTGSAFSPSEICRSVADSDVRRGWAIGRVDRLDAVLHVMDLPHVLYALCCVSVVTQRLVKARKEGLLFANKFDFRKDIAIKKCIEVERAKDV